ncbi:MAG: hypothetical protein JO001_19805 [Alphaproteobacteria bacterium]|nr:hypothetical protein [Alphaproteobacteria bacterium]
MPLQHGASKAVALAFVIGALIATHCTPASAQRPPAAVLLDRLCGHTMLHNEEDRLFGMISLTVRATIKYRGAVFSPDLIDDSIQDALGNMIAACPKIAATPDPQRLGLVVQLISDATDKRLREPKRDYNEASTDKATAADLSEELSAPEIDAWINALPPRRRALALFLYASDLQQPDIAQALGISPAAMAPEFRDVKGDLLKFFRAEADVVPASPASAAPAMEYKIADANLAALLQPQPQTAGSPTAGDNPLAAGPGRQPGAAANPRIRITGISPDIYAGWSLLATVTGLPAERNLEINAPLLLVPNVPEHRRMIVTGVEEISDPHDATRRFLLKAYAIDGEKEGAGLRDTFTLAGPNVDNPLALNTLRNSGLAAIEVARCLQYNYGTADDPGLCQ